MLPLTDFLNAHYACGPFVLEATLSTSGDRQAYRVRGPDGVYVCKLTYPGRAEEVVRADVGTPAYLSALGFPAPRPVAALGGEPYLCYGDRFAYLYEHIPGDPPRPSAEFFRQLGALLARLHSLPIGEQVPESAYRPEHVLPEARRALLACDSFVGDPGELSLEDQQVIAPRLVEYIDRFPSFAGLPPGIVHSDPYLVNLVETPGGELYLIDWEDGGVSYPLLDVAYVLAFMDTFTARDRQMWGVPGPEKGPSYRPDWGREFLAAYQQARPLTDEEKRLLPDAIRMSFIEYMPNWGTTELIVENYRRMMMVEEESVNE